MARTIWGRRGIEGSGILLTGVEDSEDLHDVGDAIDEDIVRMDHRLAGSRDAAGAVDIGMSRKLFRGVDYRVI